MRLRRFTFIAACAVLLAPAAPPAAAIGLGPLEPPVSPARSNSSDAVDGPCGGTNQNHMSPACEPFQWISILITPGPVPQFLYRPYPSHIAGSQEIPLGYMSTPVVPIRTSTHPQTYWVKQVTNLTSQMLTVTRCNYGPWEGRFGDPSCGVNTGVWNFAEHAHKLLPGQTRMFDDPASWEMKRETGNYFFPVDEDNYYAVWNQAHYLTTLEYPAMRGLLKHVYYDCSGPDHPTHCF